MKARSLLAATAALVVAGAALAAPAAQSVADTSTKARFCFGHRATIVGGKRANFLVGTRHRDIIWAGGGADFVAAKGGRDVICGGRGGDQLDGQKSLDKVSGGPGTDQCYGIRREHLHLHFQCEIHSAEPPRVPRPPKPRADQIQAAIPVKGAAKKFPAPYDFYFGWDNPTCQVGQIDMNKFYFSAEYTNPGTIAVAAYFETWGDGRWEYTGHSDWRYYTAPNDNQAYQASVGSFTGTYVNVAGYAYAWWDGSQFQNFTIAESIGQSNTSGAYLQYDPGGSSSYTHACMLSVYP